MRILRGAAASPGVAQGPWVRITTAKLPEGGTVGPDAIDAERARLAEASEAAAAALEALAERLRGQGSPDEAGIFEAQAAMARDPLLAERAVDRIRAGADAIAAVRGAAGEVAAELRALDDELLAARAADVLDVANRIVGVLAPDVAAATPHLELPAIVVADDLAPSVTASLPRDRILGIVLEGGSPSAHAAILARAYGIPAVVGVTGLIEALERDGQTAELAVDGTRGELFISPDASVREELARRRWAERERAAAALGEAALPAVTSDGTLVTLLANIGLPAEARHARELGASGVGLFRTEFLFIERAEPPTEDEQATAYREVVEAFAPDPVIVRLLDVGGDKPIPFLPLPAETNPFLGVRALRLADDWPDLFVTQLRAGMRAADGAPDGTVKVMAPMVADGLDVERLLRLADAARRGLEAEGITHGRVALGVMLEIPSAVLTAATYFDRIAFASLGTNDLTQYTLAADRGNPHLARYQDALHPAVLRLVAESVAAADRAGVELSVCGEMAGDPAAALALVGLGIRRLSMVATSLAPVRRAIRAASLDRLRQEAALALEETDAGPVRARFARLLPAEPDPRQAIAG